MEGTFDLVISVTVHTSLDFSVGANRAHGERGNDAHDGRDADDDEREADARLPHHPRDAQEQHHPPDVEQAWDQHTLQGSNRFKYFM